MVDYEAMSEELEKLEPGDELTTQTADQGQARPQDYLLALWRYRRLILLATLLSGTLALIVSMLMEPVYRARSTLILRPPRFSTDLKPVPLSVESYRAILSSDFISHKLREELKRQGFIEEQANNSGWTTSVDIYQERAASRPGERTFIPLIDLIVEAKSPDLAAQIANVWAEVFIRENSDLTTQVKKDTVAFIDTQFPAVSESLDKQETSLKGREDYFNSGRDDLENLWSQRILDLQLQQETSKTKFENETERLKTEFVNETERLRTEHEEETERQRLEFHSRFQPDLLKTELKIKEEKLASFKDQALDTSLAIHTEQQTLAQLKEQIQQLPPLLTLSKAITDEALWEKIGQGDSARLLEELGRLKLRTELLNPTYQELLGKLITAEVNVNTLFSKRDYLKDEITRLKGEIDGLKKQVTQKDLELFKLVKDRELALRNLLETRRTQQQAVMRDRELGRVALAETSAQELDVLTRSKANHLDEFERRRELEIGQLTRKTDTVRNTYKLLAEKHESAQLAKAEDESEVKIGALAVSPNRPIAPRPMLNTGLALVLGFVFSSILAFAINHLRDVRPFTNDYSLKEEAVTPVQRTFSVTGPLRAGK